MQRRDFHEYLLASAGLVLPASLLAQDQTKPESKKSGSDADPKKSATKSAPKQRVQPPFERDYPAPGFKPSWSKPQQPNQLVEDFVIYAHSDFEMTKKLLAKDPMLVYGFVDWGGGDWESALGGASHMGQRAIVEFLLKNGARMDIFAATSLGLLDVVKGMLTFEPNLINARGPHGFDLHFHAVVGGDKSSEVLKYLETIKPTPERSREMANRMRMATSKQAKSAKSAKPAEKKG